MEDKIIYAIKDMQFIMLIFFVVTFIGIIILQSSIEKQVKDLKTLIEKKAGNEKE